MEERTRLVLQRAAGVYLLLVTIAAFLVAAGFTLLGLILTSASFANPVSGAPVLVVVLVLWGCSFLLFYATQAVLRKTPWARRLALVSSALVLVACFLLTFGTSTGIRIFAMLNILLCSGIFLLYARAEELPTKEAVT